MIGPLKKTFIKSIALALVSGTIDLLKKILEIFIHDATYPKAKNSHNSWTY